MTVTVGAGNGVAVTVTVGVGEGVGVTAGASAPEVLTQEIVTMIKGYGLKVVKTLPGIEEKIVFTMPKGLQA